MHRQSALFAILASMAASSAAAQVLLDEKGEFGPEPASEIRRFAFDVQSAAQPPMFRAALEITLGKATVSVTDPAGERVLEFHTGGPMQIAQPLKTAGLTGTYHVSLAAERAVGSWKVHITTEPEIGQVAGYLASGIGMVAVGIGAFLLWWLWSRARWRWFWVGAAVWTVGVGLKIACALLLNKPVLAAMESFLPRPAYLVLGSIYIGLLTGVFEIGVTLLAALRWRKMTEDAARGVAMGVGAGAFEAVLLGVASVIGVAAALVAGGQLRDELIQAVAPLAAATPLLWLAAPVERVIAILCHTSSRALVLLGVARGRWLGPFLAGFLIMTAIDTVAGYVHLAGLAGKVSMWWIELALAPAAVLSIPIVVWCIRKWPAPTRLALAN